MAWLTGWIRRKSKTIIGSTVGIQTDYPLKLNVHKDTGTDTSTDIYIGTNVRNDFGDLRFTQSDGSTELNYWIESITGTAPYTVTVWIKINSIPTSPSTTTIFIYYDNSSATSTSSGTNTFLFFDDGEGKIPGNSLTVGGWTSVAYGTYANDRAYSGNISLKINPGTGGSFGSATHSLTKPTPNSWIAELKIYDLNYAGIYDWGQFSIGGAIGWEQNVAGNKYEYLLGGTKHATGITRTTGWHNFKVVYDGTNLSMYIDDIQIMAPSLYTDTTTSMFIGAQFNLGVWFDNIIFPKYANPEPTFSSSGSEELVYGSLNISSTPSGAEIFINDIDQFATTPAIISNISQGSYTYKLTLLDYYDSTGPFTITGGSTTTLSITMDKLPCPVSPKYSGDTITLKATPKDGIGPYYVVFRKGITNIDPSRLGGLDNPIYDAPEDTLITRVYTLDDVDIAGAPLGTIDFSVYISDSCPTGAQSCTETCTINIGCVAPVCNFVVT